MFTKAIILIGVQTIAVLVVLAALTHSVIHVIEAVQK